VLNNVFRRLTVTVIIAIIFLAFFNMTDTNWQRVNVETFEQSLMDNPDALLLDVRTTVEWEQDGHLENAILIPHSDLEERTDELPGDKEDLILLYSQSGNRSKEAAQTLLDLGYTNIVELAPGINGWKDADKPVLYGK
jgi:rhodanese-related sulfurtransferase